MDVKTIELQKVITHLSKPAKEICPNDWRLSGKVGLEGREVAISFDETGLFKKAFYPAFAFSFMGLFFVRRDRVQERLRGKILLLA
ncbi:MAG: hypothetical protein HS130_07765 [Deltaproteobacteria bacterium]|nr:hypothetical protein [Deltaproteobacteria bacterium]MCL4873093.1 hypothetical protein [bacterium]